MFQLGNFLLGTDLCTVAICNFSENRSITKKFPIKTLLKIIDSTSPRFLTLESIVFKIHLVGNVFAIDQLCTVAIGSRCHFEFFGRTGVS